MPQSTPSLKTLKTKTDEFFRRHWPQHSGDDSLALPPEWIDGWQWQGSVPYHDRSGVYALLTASGEVVYIGLGASNGAGRYPKHGLSRRLSAHVIMVDPVMGQGFYRPRPKWSDITSIATIGFPDHYSYLSAALEDFLIAEVRPRRNIMKRQKGSQNQ